MISVQNISKRYPLYRHAAERLLGIMPFWQTRASEFWALRDVSFEVSRGEVVAIIGPNGSGKSTLLQVISGILQPTTGRVLCEGRVAALLELGAGFNPEFTGRANVWLNCEILGLSPAEIKKIFPLIEAFAEIGSFIDRPVKEYSTGMYVRLAFATAIHVHPEVLIVDEALSVGDAVFAARCVHKFEELRKLGVTVLLVSHDLGLVKRLSDRAIFMLNGQVVIDASPKDAVNRYVGYVLEHDPDRSISAAKDDGVITTTFRHGDGASRILRAQILNKAGQPSKSFQTGDPLRVVMRAAFCRRAENPIAGILIRNRIGLDVFGTNTRIEGIELGKFEAGDEVEIEFELPCGFSRQDYTVTVAIQHADGLSQDWLDDVAEFTVIDSKDIAGVVNLPTRISVNRFSQEPQLEENETLKP